MQELLLKPFESVGVFCFNKKIIDYLNDYQFEIEIASEDEIPKWDTYKLRDIGLEIYVENDLIISICCSKTLSYNGFELLRKNIDFIQKSINIIHDEKDYIFLNEEETAHEVFEFNNLGLQIWQKDNVIDSIFCSA